MTRWAVCATTARFARSHSTQKERDTESGNDYFDARYYSSTVGRFISPDPSELYFADPTNPQSLNLYAYALNNPLKFADPTGMYCYYGDTDFTSAQGQTDQNDSTQWDFHSNKAECGKGDENGKKGQWYDDADTDGLWHAPVGSSELKVCAVAFSLG